MEGAPYQNRETPDDKDAEDVDGLESTPSEKMPLMPRGFFEMMSKSEVEEKAQTKEKFFGDLEDDDDEDDDDDDKSPLSKLFRAKKEDKTEDELSPPEKPVGDDYENPQTVTNILEDAEEVIQHDTTEPDVPEVPEVPEEFEPPVEVGPEPVAESEPESEPEFNPEPTQEVFEPLAGGGGNEPSEEPPTFETPPQPEEPEPEPEPESTSGPNPESNPAPIPTPEPESIQQIINRQANYNNYHPNAVSATTPDANGNVPGVTNVENNNYYINRAPVAALLAVDYLSHRSNKKRFERGQKKNKKEFDKVHEEQEETRRRLEQIAEQKKQANSSYEAKRSDNKDSEMIYNRTTNQVVENANRAEKQTFDQFEQARPNVAEYQAVPTAEAVASQVAMAESGGIHNEFQFERRHEVMDNQMPDQTLGGAGSGQVGQIGHLSTPTQDNPQINRLMDDGLSLINLSNQKTVQPSDNLKPSVYKQAAITGFWGAVAGIVMFVILYLIIR